MHPRLLSVLLALIGVLLLGTDASAAPARGTYLFDPGGSVRATRVLDVDADGRLDLVVLLERKDGVEEIVILRTPKTPV